MSFLRSCIAYGFILSLCIQSFYLTSLPVMAMCSTNPNITILEGGGDGLIGSTMDFEVEIENTGDNGFGPYVDMLLPAGVDQDDGLDLASATYLGSPLVTTTLAGPGLFDHPYAVDMTGTPLEVSIGTGEELVVIQAPFGSFTNGQRIVLNISLAIDLNADAGVALPVTFQGGFQYGCDGANNPSTDPSQQGMSVGAVVNPTVMILDKEFIGGEDETATGPNFPRTSRITVDIADQQVITPFSVTDYLPDNIVFIAVESISLGGSTITSSPSTSVPTLSPDNEVVISRPSVTGGTGDDVVIDISFYHPENDAAGNPIIPSASGAPDFSTNIATAEGTWTPFDPDDVPASVTSTDSDTSRAKALAIQKGRSQISAGSGGPGSIHQYTLQFQISDYFSIDDVIVTDVMQDGLRMNTAFSPTLTVTDLSGTVNTTFLSGASYTYDTSDIGNDPNPPTSGTVSMIFDVSQALVDAGEIDGILRGGATQGGTGVAAVGTIVYQAIVQEEYTDDYPSTDTSVDIGDRLDNDVLIEAQIIDNDTSLPLGNVEDTSSASFIVEPQTLTKALYAINGSTTFSNPLNIFPGDIVTYRITYDLPTSDVEELVITDYVPLPIYDASTISNFDVTSSPAIPLAGNMTFGPDDTLHTLSSPTVFPGAPSLSTNASTNTLTIDYGTFDDPLTRPSVIDILYSLEVSDEPIADDLKLTNLAVIDLGTTNTVNVQSESIAQVTIRAPELTITKGVVQTSNPDTVISPMPVGPVSITAPGASCPRFSGSFDSLDLDANTLDSDSTNHDGLDVVTYGVVVENIGGADVFDIVVADELPVGMSLPLSGANLCITKADGTPVSYTLPDGSPATPEAFFASGIMFTDTTPTQGLLAPYSDTGGENILFITYDVEIDATVEPNEELINIASLKQFSATEGGPNFSPAPFTDNASITIGAPTVDKVIVTTSETTTNGNNVAIGEMITYSVALEIPDGLVISGAQLEDLLDSGLTHHTFESIVASGSLTTSIPGGFATMTGSATYTTSDRRMTLDLGVLTNTDTDPSTTEYIVLTYTVLAENISAMQNGVGRNNRAIFTGPGFSVLDSAPNVTVREPLLSLNKTGPVSNVNSDRVATYTITVNNSSALGSAEDAFNVIVSDNLFAQGLHYISGTAVLGGVAPTTITYSPTLEATYDEIPLNQSATITFDVSLDTAITSDVSVVNNAQTTWTSLSGSVDGERTGTGGVNDYLSADNHTMNFVFSLFPDKSIVSTSLGDTLGQDITIGEEITYEVFVEVPELALFDDVVFVDTLSDELELVNVHSQIVSGSITSSMGSIDSIVPVFSGQQITWNLGTVENTDSDSTTVEFISFLYTTRVVNTVASNNNDLIGNSIDVIWSGGVNTSTPENFTITEPDLSITKSGPISNTNSGREIEYMLTMQHLPSSSQDAYDVVFTDTLPAQLQFISGAQVSGPIPDSLVLGSSFSAGYDTFATGDVAVFALTAKLDPSIIANTSVVNTAEASWTNVSGILTGERTSTGGVDDYIDDDMLTTLFNFEMDIDKTVVDTSVISSTGYDVVIGEEITYAVTITLPEESGFSTSMLTDTVPAGMEIIGIDSILSSGSVNNSMSASTISGDTLTFDLGTITNTDTIGTTIETLVITYTARVMNDAILDQGDDLTNFATLSWMGGAKATQAETLTVVEPIIDILKVAPGSNTLGSRALTYTFTIDHGDLSDADAFDLVVEDVLTGGTMTYVSGSLTHLSGAVYSGVSQITSTTLTVVYDTLERNESSIFSVDVLVDEDVVAPYTLVNNASVSWTSQPGSVSEERTGDGGINTYTSSDTESTLYTNAISINKTHIGTSESHTAGTNIALGEYSTYMLEITFPNISSIHDVVISDVWDAGLSFVSLDEITGSGGLILSGTTYASMISSAVVSGNTLGIYMGDIQNTDTDTGTEETIRVIYTLALEPNTATDSGDMYGNTATAAWSNGSTTAIGPELTVQESVITIDKTAPITSTDSSRTVTYTLIVAHDTDSEIDAYNVIVHDDLAILDMSVVSITQTNGPTADSIDDSGDVITIVFDELALGASATFSVVASLDAGVSTPVSIDNTADIQWSSILSGGVIATGANNAVTLFATMAESFTKEVISTSASHTSGTGIALGEEVTYRVTIELEADSTLNNTIVVDTLPDGFIFVSADTTFADVDIECAPINCASVTASPSGNTLTWNFGDITNTHTGSLETVTFDYTTVATNHAALENNDDVMNMAVLTWSDNPSGLAAEATLEIQEPVLNLTKNAPLTNTGNYARTITYTMLIEHATASTTDAFDIAITDNLNAQGMTYIPGTLQLVSGTPYNAGGSHVTAGLLTVTYDSLSLGQQSVISFAARLDDGIQTPHTVTNTASATWTSLPDDTNPNQRSGTGILPYITSDMTSVDFTTSVSAQKNIDSSSIASTTGTYVSIGEVIRYALVVAIPDDSIVQDLALFDTLDAGLLFSGVVSFVADAGVTTDRIGGFENISPILSGNTVIFDLGDITNIQTNTASHQITILYDVLVTDSDMTSRGDQLDNNVMYTWSEGSEILPPVTVEIVEPTLGLTKSGPTENTNGDRTVRYTMLLQHTDVSNADAYTVDLTDTLADLNMSIAPETLVFSGYMPTISGVVAGDLLVSYDTFPLGVVSEISFDATLDATVATPANIINIADIAWSSSPESGRNYTGDASHAVVFNSPGGVSKNILSTSESVTDGWNVAIGEEIRYSIALPIPENGALNNVVITDSLPQGLRFVGVDTITMASSVSGPTTLTPIFSGNDMLFTIGTITNTDTNDMDTESYIITYTAYAENIVENQDNDSLQNTVELSWSDGELSAVSPQLRIVEPTLVFDKTVPFVNTQSARTVTYTVSIDHASGSSAAAHDIVFTDDLHANEATYVSGSIAFATGVSGVLQSVDPLTVVFDALATGSRAEMTFEVRLDDDVVTPIAITNTGELSWTSLAGNETYERTGDIGSLGGPDDYYLQSQAATTFSSTSSLGKSLVSTNLSHTQSTGVVIGEIVTYEVRFLVDEDATLNGLEVVDILPAGMQYLSHESITAGATISSTYGAPTNIVPTYTTGANTLTYAFGNLTNTDTNITNDEEVVLRYRAVVYDDTIIQQDNILINEVTLDRSDGTLTEQAQGVSILEPKLQIEKSVPTMNMSSERTITYTISIDHTSGSFADAFDVVFEDDLLARSMEYVDESINYIAGGTGLIMNNGSPFIVEFPVLPTTGSISFSFDARLFDDIPTSVTVSNTGSLAWTSTPGDSIYERNGVGSGDLAYQAEDNASINFSTDGEIDLYLDDTNNPYTVGGEVSVGEQISYTATILVPEDGALTNSTGVILLPPHVSFISVDALFGPSSITTNLGGGIENIGYVYNPIQHALLFNFGTLSNSDTTPGDEYLEIDFSVQVDNETTVQNGTVITPSFDMTWSDASLTTTASPVVVGEPILDVIKISPVTNSDSARTVTYQVEIAHATGSAVDALDIVVKDVLTDHDLLYVPGTYTHIAGPEGQLVAGSSIEVRYDHIAVHEKSVFTFDARLSSSFETMDSIVTNEIRATWTSMPNTSGGERTGAGGINDHESIDQASILFTSSSVFTKNIVDTSADSSSGFVVAIGETVSYEIGIQVPYDSVLNNLVINDILPDGMRFEGIVGSGIVVSTGITTTLTGGFTSVVPVYTTGTNNVTFNLGDVENTNIGTGSNILVSFTYDVVIENSSINQESYLLANMALATWSDDMASVAAPSVLISEPTVTHTLTTNDTHPGNSGMVYYDVEIAHTSGSTMDAFDVYVRLPLESIDASYVSGSFVGSGYAPTNVDIGTGEIILYFSDLPYNETFVGTIGMQLSDVYLSGSASNVVISSTLDWASLPEEENTDRRIGVLSGSVNDYVHQDELTLPLTLIDLAIDHTFADDSIFIGDSSSVTIEVSNEGNSPASDIDVLIPFDFWAIESFVPEIGSFDEQTQIWTIPALEVNESVSLTIDFVGIQTVVAETEVMIIDADQWDIDSDPGTIFLGEDDESIELFTIRRQAGGGSTSSSSNSPSSGSSGSSEETEEEAPEEETIEETIEETEDEETPEDVDEDLQEGAENKITITFLEDEETDQVDIDTYVPDQDLEHYLKTSGLENIFYTIRQQNENTEGVTFIYPEILAPTGVSSK